MKLKDFTYLFLAALMWVAVSCANIGTPSGGPRDYTPPVVLKSNPKPRSMNFKGKKVTINFDEIVTIKDQQKKVVISPAQKEPASIKSLGKSIQIEFNDEMKPNTTYTIDFSDAIQDNNEGNRIDGYCFSFSTGDSIDSLSVSGVVLAANNLEPMQNVLVGLHSDLSDTAFTTLPFDRVGKTNDKGEFTVQGVHPGRYHIFALNDMDGNYKMSRNESYAFSEEIIVPSVRTYESNDTIFTFDRRIDSVAHNVKHLEYLPNDILLSMFNEGYVPLYLKKYERKVRNKLFVQFSTTTQLPTLNILEPKEHAENWYQLERDENNDSLFYWITDSALIKSDTILVNMQYLKMDSLNNIVSTNDTIKFTARKNNAEAKKKAKEQKEHDEKLKELEKLNQRREKLIADGKETADVDIDIKSLKEELKAERQVLKLDMEKKGTLDVTDTITFKFDTPIGHINQESIHLEKMRKDSTWINVVVPLQQVDEYNPMRYMLPIKLSYEGNYRMHIDSAAITTVYGITNDSISIKFNVKPEDAYKKIIFSSITNAGPHAFMELLNSKEQVIRHQTVVNGAVTFTDLNPGDYYARLVKDVNNNDEWDAGDYARKLQPEETYYYPTRLRTKSVDLAISSWDIFATPINDQKPLEIKRNKPETKKDSLEQKNKKKDEDEEDEFNSQGFGKSTYSGNKYQDYRNGVR